jgi:hypothetical protein
MKLDKNKGFLDKIDKMRFTTEQRLNTLERELVILPDTVKLLHKLLKEQRQLINEYITKNITSANENQKQKGNVRAEDALFTFVCKKKFGILERRIERLQKFVEDNRFGLKAG